MSEIPCLYLVIPCYNEEAVLPLTAQILEPIMTDLINKNKINDASRILFVDDGCKDKTWEISKSLHNQNPLFSAIKLSRNRGHQNALFAGLITAKNYADITISLDADLQDDPAVIPQMVDAYLDGNEVVYGVRKSRTTDSYFKSRSALFFYKLQQKLGAEIMDNHADCRLLSKKVLQALEDFPERQLYLRGLIPLIGFKSTTIFYDRHVRLAGESKYPLKAMLKLAKNGIFDFSDRLLAWIFPLGCFLFSLSLLVTIIEIIKLIFSMQINPTTFIILGTALIASLIITILGLMAEYLQRLYIEVKHRPRYFIESIVHKN